MDENYNNLNNSQGGSPIPPQQEPPKNEAPQQNAFNNQYNPTGSGYNAPIPPAYNPNVQPNAGGSYVNQAAPQPNNMPPQNSTPKPQKPKMSAGKIVFIVLLCLCIVIASVAIGSGAIYKAVKKDNGAVTDTLPSDEKGGIAAPNQEDSPSSLKEYTGKGPMTSEQIYQNVKEINVGILVYSQKQKIGEGSGIIVEEDSSKQYTYILTAAHVIADQGVSIQVQFYDQSEIDAQIVGFDTKTDVGVLKVKKTGLKHATFGNSDKLTVGQKVYAIGNPGGTEFFGSFTGGMISAIDRPVPTKNSTYDLPCVQHNAAINPGNSGGALVNEYGQVVGLNSSKISSTEYEGMGFSVPSNTVIKIYKDIVAHGYVSNRPMLGITYFPVSADYTYASIAWRNKLPYGSIVIATISDNSSVAKSKIKVGDMVTEVNGKSLETTDVLLEEIEHGKVGTKLVLTIFRPNENGTGGSTFKETVSLVEDKGDNIVPQPEKAPANPFESYFEDFGY